MKIFLFYTILLLTATVLFPLAAISDGGEKVIMQKDEDVISVSAKTEKEKDKKKDVFRILIKDTQKITELDSEEYILGVLSAEMPALYDEEALKAQAVAAYTYACRKRLAAKDNEYDLTDDYETDQCYIDAEARQKKWGDKTSEYTERLKGIISEVSGQYLMYDDSPALTVYHAISSGKTESCKDVWGSAVPYLIPVDSTCDKLSESYLSTVTVSADELKEKLNALCDISGSASTWFSDTKTTESGRVKTVKVCGTELTGSSISELLKLRSTNFSVAYKDDSFTFEVKGYGHGVGMSQFGADYMAKQGKSYREILAHYYPGCELKK